MIQWLKKSLLYAGELDGVATVTAKDGALRYHVWGPRTWLLTLGEVGPRGCNGDSDRQRTAIELGKVKGSSERANDKSANGKDRRESNHHDRSAHKQRQQGRGVFTEERTGDPVAKPSSFLS